MTEAAGARMTSAAFIAWAMQRAAAGRCGDGHRPGHHRGSAVAVHPGTRILRADVREDGPILLDPPGLTVWPGSAACTIRGGAAAAQGSTTAAGLNFTGGGRSDCRQPPPRSVISATEASSRP